MFLYKTHFIRSKKAISILFIFISLLLKGTANGEGENWPTYYFDNQRSGVAGSHISLPLELAWKEKIGGNLLKPFTKKGYSSPVAVEGTVYLGNSDGKFYAFDSREKRTIWEITANGGVELSPAVSGESVFFGTGKGLFYSVNRKDGKINWTYQAPSPVISPPLVKDNIVYFNTVKDRVYALNINDGKIIWQYKWKESGKIVKSFSSLSLHKGRLFILFFDGSLVVLNSKNGKEINSIAIRSKTEESLSSSKEPVIAQGLIYIAVSGRGLLTFDEDLKKLWSYNIVSDVSEFIVTKSKVILIDDNGGIFAFNKVTGEELWVNEVIKGTPTNIITSRGFLVITTKHISYLFKKNILPNQEGHIEIFDLNSGKKVWSYKTDTGVSASPVIADSKLFIVTDGGKLLLFKTKEG